jgi:hypothetical protein
VKCMAPEGKGDLAVLTEAVAKDDAVEA